MAIEFSRTDVQFQEVKKAVVEALRAVFPIEGKMRRMVLKGVEVEDTLDPTDYKSQAAAKIGEKTWGVPVYAHLQLIGEGRRVIDENNRVKLFTLPKPTQRHSYIVGGNEYQVHNQLRLRPGVYTIKQQNGELKTQVNLAKGKNFELHFNENKGLFTISKVGGGQANIPLMPILTHLGIPRSEVTKTFGERITASNELHSDPKAVEKLRTALGLRGNKTVSDAFNATQLDPETTKIALGKSFDKVDGQMLLASAKQLLDVHMGRRDPTDRDSLEFKELHGVDDFIKERLEKNKSILAGKIRRNIDNPRKEKISQLVSSGAFSGVVEDFFLKDDKAATPEQTNPLEMITGTQAATFMGAGGIGSEHAIKDEMRQIHPSHFGLVDPVHTPESGRIGVNLHVPLGAVKDGKELKMRVVDKTGKQTALGAKESREAYIMLPGQTGETVKAMYRGSVVEIPRSKAQYSIPDQTDLFSWSTNLVPFLPSAQGNRAMMAAKMMEQAISLKNREAPLVQSLASDGSTMEAKVGEQASIKSPEDGVIKEVAPDHITLTTAAGKDIKINLYNNFALNRKSFLHSHPIVKVGDRVTKGQLLSDSNYTKGGVLALGTNLKTAYIPYKGYNFDDGIVISQAASEKLTSEHIYKKEFPITENTVLKLSAFRSFYPNAIGPDNFSKLDGDGVINKHARVKHGDVIVAGLQKRAISGDVQVLSKVLSERPKDTSIVWTMEDDGEVLDVIKTPKKVTVVIKTEEAAKIGDKLAGRHGNKGVITKIIPDAEMPHDKSGNPMDILLNPMGVISRINVSQLYESAAAKVAEKEGKPHLVKNFDGSDQHKAVTSLLKKTGVTDKEELLDPTTGKSLGQVHVGTPHILKLFKQSQGNYSVRQGGPGAMYDANLQPTKGGEEGAKSVDVLTMYSLLSHGARENLREMSSIKSTKNDEFWKAFKAGEILPPPKAPFVYDRFMAYLKGAGIDVKKDGSRMMLAPFTDKQVKETSSGKITKPEFYRAKDFSPIKGGFFDPRTFGTQKDQWGHLELAEPVVNPPFETAVKKLTGLGKKYDSVVAGKLFLDDKGNLNADGKGVTGGAAIEQMLKGINVDAQMDDLTKKALKAKGNKLDEINKKLRYLKSLKDLGLKPEEAYIRRALPVVPPQFRPVYPLPDGNMVTSDSNVLYQNTGVLNTMMKLPVMDLLAETDKANIRKELHEHTQAVSGLLDMNIKGKERNGFISEIKGGAGGQPKEGFFISKLLSKKQDYVGRGTIIPEPSLGIDEMAMPEPMAWKLFEPFVIREMKNHGKTPLQAMEEIKNKTSLAKRALEIVMEKRHVLLNRAPSLHKYSIMAFKPKITDGKAIKIPPLVNKGFNADYDGDTMTVHAPITEEANTEAEKMLPSRNLFKPGTGSLMIAPGQEAQIGLFYLSKTDAGRARLNKLLKGKWTVDKVLDKKGASALLDRIAKEAQPKEFANIVHDLKNEGEKHSYERGFTLGLDDIKVDPRVRNKVVDKAKDLINKHDPHEVNKALTKQVDDYLGKKFSGKDNPFYDMIASGARGSPSQLRSIMFSPMFVADHKNDIVKTPISKSYAEGLDVADYWTSMYGARKGMMDRAIQTSLPGAFSKDVMNTAIDVVVSATDCGTRDGVELPLSSQDVTGRYLAGDQSGLKHDTIVDVALVNQLKKRGVKMLKVRSPLKCRRPKGVCAHCYGIDEHGHTPEVGENVGAKAGQTISEPLIQIMMNSFHTGGAAGTGAQAGGFSRISQLLHLPDTLAGAAALAPIDGKVTKVVKGIAGGFDVTVGDQKTHIPQGQKPLVTVGQVVEKGDVLSTGPVKPQELTKLKNMDRTQDYLTDELQKTYKEQGVGINRKTFETVVRNLTNATQVINNPKSSTFLPGDVVPFNEVRAHNENRIKEVSVDNALGHELAEDYGMVRKGKELTQKDVSTLKALGRHRVKILLDEIEHQPFVKGITGIPLLKKDWMAALGYRNLSKVLTEGASQGWQTDIEGHHPLPALAHGATFGKAKEKEGRY